jgi:hypothetical protein
MRSVDVNGLLSRAAERLQQDEVAVDGNPERLSAIAAQGVYALL